MVSTPLELIDEAISELEAKLNIASGTSLSCSDNNQEKNPQKNPISQKKENNKQNEKKKKGKENTKNVSKKNAPANQNQPHICKLEFKVGVITKVWVHPDADKLYCEEIDCGEEQPRQIASGLRQHYDEKTMLGQRLLVVSNLKVGRFFFLF